MGTNTSSGRLSLEAPRVGAYRRGVQLRTTPAGTWFRAVGPSDDPAGLLLIHPAVSLRMLIATVDRLAELAIPGVLPIHPELAEHAGRAWLITTAPPWPTLADVLDTGPQAGNAAALLRDIADTLIALHHNNVAHGGITARSVVIGQHGGAFLTDWATNATATCTDDVTAWTQLADLITQRWCAEASPAAASLAAAVNMVTTTGLATGLEELHALSDSTREAQLAPVRPRLEPLVPGRIRLTQSASPGRTRPADPLPGPPAPQSAAAVSPAESPAVDRPPREPLINASDLAIASGTSTGAQAVTSEASEKAAISTPEVSRPGEPDPTMTQSTAAGPVTETRTSLRESPRRGATPPWRLVSFAAVILFVLFTVLIEFFLLLGRDQPPPRPPMERHPEAAPLQVHSVVLQTQKNGPICALVGVITTNGQAGTVVYRWEGAVTVGQVMTVATPDDSNQIVISLLWSDSQPPAPDAVLTLRILGPDPQQSSTQPAPQCGSG